MPWYAVRPRDPADPRWPLPGKPQLVLKGDDPDDAREKFEQAYLSTPFGTPATPVPDRHARDPGARSARPRPRCPTARAVSTPMRTRSSSSRPRNPHRPRKRFLVRVVGDDRNG